MGGIVVFDVTNKGSFENVPKWVDEIRYYSEPDVVLLMVGNKTEKENEKDRVVSLSKALELAKDLECEYFETTIWNEKSVENVFIMLAKKIYEKREIFRKMNLEKKKCADDRFERKRKCC